MTSFAPIEAYLTVADAEMAIAFYERGFGGRVAYKQLADDGKRVLHATLNLFGGQVMLSDHFPEHSGDTAPPGTASVTIHVNFADPAAVDAAMATAAAAGADITMPAQDTFWGMRYGRLIDPAGHSWSFGAPLPTKTEGRLV